jgi:hypothetical protein
MKNSFIHNSECYFAVCLHGRRLELHQCTHYNNQNVKLTKLIKRFVISTINARCWNGKPHK